MYVLSHLKYWHRYIVCTLSTLKLAQIQCSMYSLTSNTGTYTMYALYQL